MESATCCGMESDRRSVWNQSEGKCTLARDAIRLRRLHTRSREITYQSFGLDRKKTVRKRSFFLAPPALLEPDDQRLAEPTVTTFRARVEKVARLPLPNLTSFSLGKKVAMGFFPFCEANKGGALSPLRKNVRLTRSVYRALLRRAKMALRNETNEEGAKKKTRGVCLVLSFCVWRSK